MLRFPDDIQVRVNGLDEILADLYSEGRQANKETAEKNYIPSSDRTRKEFAYVLLKEYREYVEGRTDNKG